MCATVTEGSPDPVLTSRYPRERPALRHDVQGVTRRCSVNQKKPYATPRIESLGAVSDLTRAGWTTPIVRDFKQGSSPADPDKAKGI